LILFADTSALVKLYVVERGSAEVQAAVGRCSALAVTRITWVEMMSAFARRAREQSVAAEKLNTCRTRLTADWPQFFVLELTPALAHQAGELAETFGLRAYDSVQLAAVQALQLQQADEVHFACFDSRLRKAAAVLGVAAGVGV
jgi:uncharacterized protein